MSNVLTMILAGGEGARLKPLTAVRTKPAVPFGGNYRIIEFVLSNFVNSGFLKIFVLTQFKSHSLMRIESNVQPALWYSSNCKKSRWFERLRYSV